MLHVIFLTKSIAVQYNQPVENQVWCGEDANVVEFTVAAHDPYMPFYVATTTDLLR